jgi:ring-1,2-phenylacetyl-CoA epoxidase subunit PaaC
MELIKRDSRLRGNYILEIADNSLILGQRLGELCGHGPSLETDIAVTNMSLAVFGPVRSYYTYNTQH